MHSTPCSQHRVEHLRAPNEKSVLLAKLNPMTNKTRDNPSTTFAVDPYIQLLTQQNGDQFGIVLVANWPPSQSTTQPYKIFLEKVHSCFEPEDLRGNPPAAYFYPPEHLHITIATFTPFTTSKPDDIQKYSECCTRVMKQSFEKPDWPNAAFSVEIDRMQIGEKAGIILWRDDGQFAAMRKILQEEFDNNFNLDPSAFDNRRVIIPPIIHSTFLRFGRTVRSDGEVVQAKFKEICSEAKELFGKVEVKSMKLVIERVPYMHIPCDENHVLASHNCEE